MPRRNSGTLTRLRVSSNRNVKNIGFDKHQHEISHRKPYFEYFFRATGRQVVQVKAKNPKTTEYLKWK